MVGAHEDRDDNDKRQQWCTCRNEEAVVQGCTIIHLSEGRLKSRHLSSLNGMRTCIILSLSLHIFLTSVHPNHDRNGWIINVQRRRQRKNCSPSSHLNQPRQGRHHQTRARRGRFLHQPDFAIFINFSPGEGTDCLDTPPVYITWRRQLHQLYI